MRLKKVRLHLSPHRRHRTFSTAPIPGRRRPFPICVPLRSTLSGGEWAEPGAAPHLRGKRLSDLIALLQLRDPVSHLVELTLESLGLVFEERQLLFRCGLPSQQRIELTVE